MLTRRGEARLRDARRAARRRRLALVEEVRAAVAHAESCDGHSTHASTSTAHTAVEPRTHSSPHLNVGIVEAGTLYWHPFLKVRVIGVNVWDGRNAEPSVQIARACETCGLPTGSFLAQHCAKHAR